MPLHKKITLYAAHLHALKVAACQHGIVSSRVHSLFTLAIRAIRTAVVDAKHPHT
jgi:hypothetical protein